MSFDPSENVIKQASAHGLSQEELKHQLTLFRQGVPNLKLSRPATISDGILQFDADKQNKLIHLYQQELAACSVKVMKFVPASGAASRMFRNLETLLNTHDEITNQTLSEETDEAKFGKVFLENIRSFAFWQLLKKVMFEDQIDAEELLQKGDFRPLIDYTLNPKGLNYSAMPKALIEFHIYPVAKKRKTSLEEHFTEGIDYAQDGNGDINLHFTVSPEFNDAFNKKIKLLKEQRKKQGLTFNVYLSHQEPYTDTIAVDENDDAFLDDDNNVLFRPGGHGALLDNLNKLKADIVFIKNIDNVVPDSHMKDTVRWKQVLGGLLLELRNTLFAYRKQLREAGAAQSNNELINKAASFFKEQLNLSLPDDFDSHEPSQKQDLLLRLSDRPIRVCGMVKNEGEPGGGPFWVEKSSYVNKLQIVESSQIDTENAEQMEILKTSTHFNPVDIVCSLTDENKEPYNLEKFIDEETAFIADKSYNGRSLKALERPGLWNGAMANWITVFIEVPVSTFNPVKTVNDLLRKQHRQ